VPEYDPGSFRDREGRVFEAGGEIVRALSAPAAETFRRLAATRFFAAAMEEGRIVRSALATEVAPPPSAAEPWAAVVRHARIPVVSYPYEWTFSMLRDAALLQLDLHLAALEEGFGLKDATPYNVQFRGAHPVFVDVGSFEPLRPGEPWIGYRQFCQLYLYPLLLAAYRGLDHRVWLRASLAGIAPADARRLFSLRDALRPGVLAHVVLHARAVAAGAGRRGDAARELRDAGFGLALVRANLSSLRRLVAGLRAPASTTAWSHYDEALPYTAEGREEKRELLRAAIAACRPRVAWDVGCNTGEYSRIAAELGATVVAMDADPAAVERLYLALREEPGDRILPLVVDVADVPAGLGWRGRERRALEQRARPELVVALALLHHLAITANLPLQELVSWLGSLGDELVVEFVHREDPMVQRLLAGRPDRFPDYDLGVFEPLLRGAYEIVSRRTLSGGTRTLFHARKRG
jgi:SAM-dependent methyltransferase